MNDIAGPTTGLDMLLLFAGANPADAGSIAVDGPYSTFEAALAGNSHSKKSPTGDVKPEEVAPDAQSTTRRDRELTPVCALPLEWGDLANAPLTAEQSTVIREVRAAVEVCFAASEFADQSAVGDVDGIPDLYEAPPHHSALAQSQIAGAYSKDDASTSEAQSNPSSMTDDAGRLLRDEQFDVRSIADDEFAIDSADAQATVSLADRFEPVRLAQWAIQQLRDAIIQSINPHVVVRVQRAISDALSPRQLKGTRELADKWNQSSTALDSTSFDAATQPPATEVAAPVATQVTAPMLIDELAADAGRFDSNRDEVVVELNIPDWGVLEIEVTREGDETEVSLLADPALNSLIRDHLPELTEALLASGIDLAGLDVRQHDRERHAGDSHEVFLPNEGTETGRSRSNAEVHFAEAAARTGLSRYRLMSVTA